MICMWVLMELKLILTELQLFKLSHFGSFFALYDIINYSFWRILFKLCKHVGSTMKIRVWLFDIDKINGVAISS